MGKIAIPATLGAKIKNAVPTTIIVVITWVISFAPTSKNRSNWLISSLRIDIKPPVLRSSK